MIRLKEKNYMCGTLTHSFYEKLKEQEKTKRHLLKTAYTNVISCWTDNTGTLHKYHASS